LKNGGGARRAYDLDFLAGKHREEEEEEKKNKKKDEDEEEEERRRRRRRRQRRIFHRSMQGKRIWVGLGVRV